VSQRNRLTPEKNIGRMPRSERQMSDIPAVNELRTISCWLDDVTTEVNNLVDDLDGCGDERLDRLEALCDRAKMRDHLNALAVELRRVTRYLGGIAGDDDQLDIITAELRDNIKAWRTK